MWKFQNFSAAQILREINFGESRGSKTAVFVILESEFFSFGQFQPSKSAKNSKKSNFRALAIAKMTFFEL